MFRHGKSPRKITPTLNLFQSTRPCERDAVRSPWRQASSYFNPRAPRGARLQLMGFAPVSALFQSTRPAWGATAEIPNMAIAAWISIHAPRVGRDRLFLHRRRGRRDFNPRAPRGARRSSCSCRVGMELFQSTRPAWGATWRLPDTAYFVGISIHAPRVGRDGAKWHEYLLLRQFQSTRPAWGATR